MPQTLGAYLTVKDAAAAVEFYKTAFAAEEVMRAAAPDNPEKVWHAELKLFGGTLMLSDDFGEGAMRNPLDLGGTSFNMIVSFDSKSEVDAAVEKAREAGAEVVMPVDDQPWGARFGMVRDPFGHMWGFSAD